MPRIAPALAQLADQVTRINHNAKISPIGPQDGFGVIRTIEFDARTSKWLAPALNAMQDTRIAYVDYEGKGRAQVTCVDNTIADRRTEYPLETVLRVLMGQDD